LSKTYFLENINEELQKDFKTACAHYGLSMKEVLIRHMQNIVNDYRKEKRGLGKPKTYTKKKGES